METLTSFASVFLQWLDKTLKSVFEYTPVLVKSVIAYVYLLMETLTDFADVFFRWLGSVLKVVLEYTLIFLKIVFACVYLLVVAAWTLAVAVFHWFVDSLYWLFNTTVSSLQWLVAYLKVSEYTFAYGFGVVATVMLTMIILLVRLTRRASNLEDFSNRLYQQNIFRIFSG